MSPLLQSALAKSQLVTKKDRSNDAPYQHKAGMRHVEINK